jgi:sterol desaturase/sphingolipid hydroxylase (fatty acid hydroxylase superfamily)
MLSSIGLYLALTSWGFGLQLASYGTAAVAALLITALEKACPHLERWQGNRNDVRVDLTFMIAIQVALPTLLAVTLSTAAVDWADQAGWQPSGLWPHQWPTGLQVILMLLSAEFFRYWLHVAAHNVGPLWRLHSVHHSVDKLYWLNVGRFHPLEKGLQYLLDALPFILMQVSPEVIALYLVFYSINGFFQHSNVELRFGWLNYVISSAELHRWHHSRRPEESNNNYGNNLIVWDLLFGTRFLPKDREVVDLGLPNINYPRSFLAQMKAPFIAGIHSTESPIISWRDIGLNWVIWLRMKRLQLTAWRDFINATREPAKTQRQLLRAILRKNTDTKFGQDHNFEKINDYESFRNKVPVQTYDDLSPYIEAHMLDGSPQLTAEPPVMYAQTSGTTGKAKYIPVLKATLDAHRKAQNLFAVAQFREVPEAYYGRTLAIVSPAIEGSLENGAPYGSTSGQVYKNMPGPTRAKYIIPWQVFEVANYDLKYRLILRLAVAEKTITHLASANPSTFLKLLETARSNRKQLLADIESGNFSDIDQLPEEARAAVREKLHCSAERINELRAILSRQDFELSDLWPYLRLVTTWTGGNCGIALDAARTSLPPNTRIADPGYLSSEFRGSVTIDINAQSSVPNLTECFFEFVEKNAWENGEQSFLTLDQLADDTNYYVIATTQSGLYRYFINDIVRTSGMANNTPAIVFLQKGRGVTNITGEKLAESQVIEAVQIALKKRATEATFFIMLADSDNSHYRLLLEKDQNADLLELALEIDQNLQQANIEYREKRASGRLGPTVCLSMTAGFYEACKQQAVAEGQRESQFKLSVLQNQTEFLFDWQSWVRVTD